MSRTCFSAAQTLLLLLAPSAVGQTLPSGTINVPPASIGNRQTIGSNTTLNVAEGGSVGFDFNAGLPDGSSTGVVVNVNGGAIGGYFTANAGSTVNINGGSVDEFFRVRNGSDVRIGGGTVGRRIEVDFGTSIALIGGEFRLNGSPYAGASLTFSARDVLSGTLADGSPFIFSPEASDLLGNVELVQTAVPPSDTSPILVDAANPTVVTGLRSGQSLTLRQGGTLDDSFAVVGASLIVEGGAVGRGAEGVGATIDISGGAVGTDFGAMLGSTVNIRGGTVDAGLTAFSGSTINVSGGRIGYRFRALRDSVVNVSGGIIGRALEGPTPIGFGFAVGANSIAHVSGGEIQTTLRAGTTSHVTISGGIFSEGLRADSVSYVNLRGLEFFLDGEPIENHDLGSTLSIDDRDVTLSGTLADGEPFSFLLDTTESLSGDFFSPRARLTITRVAALAADYNNDGVVDAADYTVWRDTRGSSSKLAADGNYDGVVDQADYDLWASRFATSSNHVSVPEPTGLGLLSLAVLLTRCYRLQHI